MDAQLAEFITVRGEVAHLHLRKEDLQEGDLLHRVGRFDRYVVRPVLVSDLNLGEFSLDEDKVAEYMEQFRATGSYPRIVFDAVSCSVIDGLHRANALARCGLAEIEAYVGTKENLDPNWVADGDDDCENDSAEDLLVSHRIPQP
jgi:hypothetical protein